MQLPGDVPGERLKCPRVEANPQDLPHSRRSASMAGRDGDGRPARNAARPGAHNGAQAAEDLVAGIKSGRVRPAFRRAVEGGDVAVNPCMHRRLPAVVTASPRHTGQASLPYEGRPGGAPS